MGHGPSKINDVQGQAVSSVTVNNESIPIHNEDMIFYMKCLVIIALIFLVIELLKLYTGVTKRLQRKVPFTIT